MDQTISRDIYLLAGVATRPGFFLDCERQLAELCRLRGWDNACIRVLYPYGDYTRSLIRQIHDVRRDLRYRKRAACAAIGAEDVRAASAGRHVVLIGHSGGGVAAYQLGKQLLEEGAIHDCSIVQIGSPRVRVAPEMRDKVSYFYAVNGEGKRNDPVTRLGSWGGFRLSAAGLPLWDPFRYAPGHIDAIPVVGGHADYFRGREPFLLENASNLQRTLALVWAWLAHADNKQHGGGNVHDYDLSGRQPIPHGSRLVDEPS